MLLKFILLMLVTTTNVIALNTPKESNDTIGGNWKTYVVNPELFSLLLTPLNLTDSHYISELQEACDLQDSLTDEQINIIRYWDIGAILGWNKIARNFAAKYNQPPLFGIKINPIRPYTSPPIASRIYALLSVAQFDALVCAWKIKYMYHRIAPLYLNLEIKQIVPISKEFPTYPSEHAVVARTSSEILKFLFPGDSAQIERLVLEHCQSRIHAGANTRSEILAGDLLGRLVAAQVIAYAKTDGAINARGGDTLFTNPIHWISQLKKPLPPMLPLWGAVRMWNIRSVSVVSAGPPPTIGSAGFKSALDEVYYISLHRTYNQLRIVQFWADGFNTSSPPGHWNEIAEGLIRENNFSEIRAARTFALLNTALMDAGISCWSTKYTYIYPRPSQMDSRILPATGLPNFPSYTSGHAAFSGAAATVLSYIFPASAQALDSMAQEAAMSRLYGGIHYRFDNDSGLVCGRRVGAYAIERGQKDGSLP